MLRVGHIAEKGGSKGFLGFRKSGKKAYNELGELIEKNLHSEDQGSSFAQSIDYRYNIRGWLTRINNSDLSDGEGDYFGMEMGYNEDIGIGNTPRYNGDVSGIKWSTDLGLADIDQRANTYTYDVMDRLKSANHQYKIGSWQPSMAHSVSNINYNLNGSPTEVIRKDMLGNDLDVLSYVYDGNQPVNITDTGNNDYGFRDGNKHAVSGIDDYEFDENGNLSRDENKDIIRYSYNYLNLPDSIILTGNRLVKFFYDAAGMKLAQLNYENGALVKRRDYIGEFFYENDSLRHISHEEGRIVMDFDGTPVYTYTISDNLQNGWLSFTTKTDTWVFDASMESESAGNEEALFSNVQETRATFSSANHTPGGNEVAELKSSQPIGPALSLHVFPGDTVSMEVYAYYEGGNGYSSTTALSTFIGAVAGAFGGVNGGTEAGQQATFDAFDNTLGTLGLNGTGSDNVPAAYLNYILFDKHLNYKASGFTQISTAANMSHERLAFDDLIMEHEGLLYIYASHESANGRTFFDDLKVTYAEGPIVGTNTFFPNGGRMEALSFDRPTSPINRFKYIDRELVDDYGVELYDHLARFYDPWWTVGYTGIDPLADEFSSVSPYQYAFMNPARYIDKTGMAPEDGVGNGPCGDKPCPENEEEKAEVAPAPSPVLTPLGLLGALLGFTQTDQYMIQEATPEYEPKPVGKPREDDDSAEDNDDEDEYLYRAMELDIDGTPKLPSDPNPEKVVSKELGVREVDIANLRNSDGSVSPGTGRGGMSTSTVPNFPSSIQNRIDAGKLTVFRIKRSTIMKYGLTQDQDGATHVSVQPGGRMTPNVFQANVMATKYQWKPVR